VQEQIIYKKHYSIISEEHFSYMEQQSTGRANTRIGRFIQYRPLIHELVTRDLKVKYRRSFLGYLWSLLNPLLMMAIQAFVFSHVFKSDIENFPMYLICGNTLFNFFNEATTAGMDSILSNGALIKKVYIPKYIFPISRVASSFVTMLFSMGAIIIVMIATRSPIHLTAIMCWFPLLCLFVFCCGVALFLSALAVYFRDVKHLYGVVTMGLMYGTPLFYPISIIPENMQWLIKINPLYHYINLFRHTLVYGDYAGFNTWFACVASALVMLVLGWAVFHKAQRNFILYI